MMRRNLFGSAIVFAVVFTVTSASAFPGILQLASRSGFWSNDFPDTAILAQHWYYYAADEAWDDQGDEVDIDELKITGSFTRVLRPWHFGDANQFQYILQGIFPYYNISIENSTNDDPATPANESTPGTLLSGVGDPMIYTALGWNNPDKTTHVQGAMILSFPLGDEDVSLTNNGYAIMPLLGFEQRMGPIWFDGSIGYWKTFDDLRDNGNEASDYFEVNGALTYRFAKAWIYLQADYTKYNESETNNVKNGDDGYNIMLAPSVGVAIRPNMTLDLKVGFDVDGENETKGQSLNLRYLWVF